MEPVKAEKLAKQIDVGTSNNAFSSNLGLIRDNTLYRLSEFGDDRAPEAINPQYVQRDIPKRQEFNDCVLVAVEIITDGEVTRERLLERLNQDGPANIYKQGTTTNAMLKVAREFGLAEEFVRLDEKTIRENLSANQPLYVVHKSEFGVGRFSPYSSSIDKKKLSKTNFNNPASSQENIEAHVSVIVGIESFEDSPPVVIMMDGFGITRMNLDDLQRLHQSGSKHDTSAPWSDSETPMAMVLKRKE